MTRSPREAPWVPGHVPVAGHLTHASAGGLFPNMLKRAGLDHLVIDGRADRPVRILVAEGKVEILDAEDGLFETVDGRRAVRTAAAITDFLSAKHPGSSTMCLGPAGWNKVAFACLTGDYHRNFGRGGAGAVFGSKNLVAVTALGHAPTTYRDAEAFKTLAKEIDALVESHVHDPAWTASFRPTTGTTWWLDRAFNGKYLGKQGGYLPWHNFDEGSFDPALHAKAATDAFLEISGRHHVCNRCRHVMCTRTAKVPSGPYAGDGVRPEFETVALWINCGITDREAIFHLNKLCNELGVDTMTLGSVVSGAMELEEKGFLKGFAGAPKFGDAAGMVAMLRSLAYGSSDLGRLFGTYSDEAIAGVAAAHPAADRDAIARCVTTAYGGLGYAGIEPKAFPGMFTAYSTSNRGRGDHTYAWTIQAEEGGLSGAGNLAAYVGGGQVGKALVDSKGLCDFFCEDNTSELFLKLYHALTGFEYTTESMKTCGARIYTLERHVNNRLGRKRVYDAYIPPKLTVPMTGGRPHGAGGASRLSRRDFGRLLRPLGLDEGRDRPRGEAPGLRDPRRLRRDARSVLLQDPVPSRPGDEPDDRVLDLGEDVRAQHLLGRRFRRPVGPPGLADHAIRRHRPPDPGIGADVPVVAHAEIVIGGNAIGRALPRLDDRAAVFLGKRLGPFLAGAGREIRRDERRRGQVLVRLVERLAVDRDDVVRHPDELPGQADDALDVVELGVVAGPDLRRRAEGDDRPPPDLELGEEEGIQGRERAGKDDPVGQDPVADEHLGLHRGGRDGKGLEEEGVDERDEDKDLEDEGDVLFPAGLGTFPGRSASGRRPGAQRTLMIHPATTTPPVMKRKFFAAARTISRRVSALRQASIRETRAAKQAMVRRWLSNTTGLLGQAEGVQGDEEVHEARRGDIGRAVLICIGPQVARAQAGGLGREPGEAAAQPGDEREKAEGLGSRPGGEASAHEKAEPDHGQDAEEEHGRLAPPPLEIVPQAGDEPAGREKEKRFESHFAAHRSLLSFIDTGRRAKIVSSPSVVPRPRPSL